MRPIKQVKQYISEPANIQGYGWFSKLRELLEEKDGVTIDSAYPEPWAKEVRRYFNVNNIGHWCWYYSPEHTFGTCLPVNERAMTLFELMANNMPHIGHLPQGTITVQCINKKNTLPHIQTHKMSRALYQYYLECEQVGEIYFKAKAGEVTDEAPEINVVMTYSEYEHHFNIEQIEEVTQ